MQRIGRERRGVNLAKLISAMAHELSWYTWLIPRRSLRHGLASVYTLYHLEKPAQHALLRDGVACARFYVLDGYPEAYTGLGEMEMYDSWLICVEHIHFFFERESGEWSMEYGVWRAEIEGGRWRYGIGMAFIGYTIIDGMYPGRSKWCWLTMVEVEVGGGSR